MSAQPSLFDAPRVYTGPSRRTDPDTSRAAARSVGHGAEQAILDVFRPGVAITDDEIAEALGYRGLYPSTVKSARSRLAKAGLLVAAGEGLSNRGRRMTKWRLP